MSEKEQREKLVELLKQTCHCQDEDCSNCSSNGICFTYKDADHLLENGVIVPPVKVGDTVYEIQQDRTLQKWYVYGIIKYDGQEWAAEAQNSKNRWNYIGKTFAFRLFGKTVFLTKKQAEKALKEGAKNEL